MTGLAGVELLRLLSRTSTQLAALGVVLAIGLGMFVFSDSQTAASAQQQQTGQAAYNRAVQDWAATGPAQIAACRAQEAAERADDPAVDLGCGRLAPAAADFGSIPVPLREAWPPLVIGAAYLLMLLCFTLGVLFVATELGTGAITLWLTFQPRRGLVQASKAVAVALVSLALVASALTVVVLAAFLVTEQHDNAGMDSGQWWELLAAGARAIALCSLAGVAGAAIAFLVRGTLTVLLLVATHLIIVESVLAGFVPEAQPWLARLNVDAWIRSGTTYYLQRCSDGPSGCVGVERTITFSHSAAYLGVGLAVLATAAMVSFRRRDFT